MRAGPASIGVSRLRPRALRHRPFAAGRGFFGIPLRGSHVEAPNPAALHSDAGHFNRETRTMTLKTLLAVSALALSLPMAAQAQGLVRGAERGAQDGADAAGPLGAIVGGAVGAATGTVGGILGVDDRPRFRQYVTRERRSSYAYDGDVRVGTVLPSAGVTYYDVPDEYNARDSRYTIVNERPVLVDRSRRIVEVID